jgi:hypothetical protein
MEQTSTFMRMVARLFRGGVSEVSMPRSFLTHGQARHRPSPMLYGARRSWVLPGPIRSGFNGSHGVELGSTGRTGATGPRGFTGATGSVMMPAYTTSGGSLNITSTPSGLTLVGTTYNVNAIVSSLLPNSIGYASATMGNGTQMGLSTTTGISGLYGFYTGTLWKYSKHADLYGFLAGRNIRQRREYSCILPVGHVRRLL